jgi:hypothetical protein
MVLRRRLALVLATALLVPACGGGTTTPTGTAAVITVTVDPNPVPPSQNLLTGAVSVGYKVLITETNGGGGEVLFVSSQIFDPATGAQVALTYFDSSDLVVFVGSKKIEPKGTLTVPQTATYVLPNLTAAANMTVNIQVQGEQGALINKSILVKIE